MGLPMLENPVTTVCSINGCVKPLCPGGYVTHAAPVYRFRKSDKSNISTSRRARGKTDRWVTQANINISVSGIQVAPDPDPDVTWRYVT